MIIVREVERDPIGCTAEMEVELLLGGSLFNPVTSLGAVRKQNGNSEAYSGRSSSEYQV
jgi:hypothetical protein